MLKPAEHDHQVTLALEVNQKQVGQLYREWYAHRGRDHVSSGAGTQTAWAGRIRPTGVAIEESRSAAGA